MCVDAGADPGRGCEGGCKAPPKSSRAVTASGVDSYTYVYTLRPYLRMRKYTTQYACGISQQLSLPLLYLRHYI